MAHRLLSLPSESPPAPTWAAVACARDECEAQVIVDVLRHHGIPTVVQRTPGADATEPSSAGPWVVLAATECAEGSKNLLDWLDLGDDPPGARA